MISQSFDVKLVGTALHLRSMFIVALLIPCQAAIVAIAKCLMTIELIEHHGNLLLIIAHPLASLCPGNGVLRPLPLVA